MSASQVENSHWISRTIAFLGSVVAAVWLVTYVKTLPDYSAELTMEKGSYRGPAGEAIGSDSLEALRSRSRSQSF